VLPKTESRIVLVSADRAITLVHIDHSATCVFYFVLTGVKIFYFLPRTKKNLELLKQWREAGSPSTDFFSHPELEGVVKKVILQAGEALLMPANMIHMVQTIYLSVAIGINFIHKDLLSLATDVFIEERTEKLRYNKCLNCFPVLFIFHLFCIIL
jgi:hypothetical protein